MWWSCSAKTVGAQHREPKLRAPSGSDANRLRSSGLGVVMRLWIAPHGSLLLGRSLRGRLFAVVKLSTS
jgi:hypothetical protein